MSVQIERLSVEHHQVPLGIAETSPRLSWRFGPTTTKNWMQTKYEIEINRHSPDHGKSEPESYSVDSADSILVPWPSNPLSSREGATVRVRSQGSDGEWTNWAEVYLQLGLLQREEWGAKVIMGEKQDLDAITKPIRVRKSFDIPSGAKTDGARLYATALGMYEIYINGQKVGDQVLAPGWQSYDYRIAYQTYDISSLLRTGTNVIAAWIGEGWYVGRMGYRNRRNIYGDRQGLIAQLEVGGKALVQSDESWEWAYGSLKASEIYDGEVWDSAEEKGDEGWKEAKNGKGGEIWQKVEVMDIPPVGLVSTQAPRVREVERFGIKEIITTPKGKTIIDFGQNFCGYVRILSEPPTTAKQLVLAHAEVLEHGELGTRPLRNCKATDTIILGGKVAGWTPKFSFHGFRYVQVDGWAGIKVGDIESVVVHSAMERTGHFDCSHELINRLHKNVVYSTLSNTLSIPTDCPQRDERLGWTGDIQVFTPTLSYLFDSSGFLANWLKDLYHDQKQLEGVVPVVIPNITINWPAKGQSQAIWGDVAAITPSDLYASFADKRILEDQYDSMVLWLDKGVMRDEKTGLWALEYAQLADWLAPAAPPTMPALAPTDNWLVADAYLIYTTRVAAKVCRVIGKESKANEYERQAESMLTHFYEMYVTPRGRVMSDTQTAMALLIQFDLFPTSSPEIKQIIFDRLEYLTRKDLFRVSTGFAGTPIILLALEKAGHLRNAYRMLQEPTCPSFLSPVLLGATTIWERWDSMLQDGSINPGEMTSFNHYALGSVAHFMHTVIGGISPMEPGWKKASIKPQPGGTITSASVSYVSGYGKLACQWKVQSGRMKVEVEVPANTTAVVELPDGKKEEVGSGKYSYDVEFKADPHWPPKLLQPPCCPPVKDSFLP